MKKEELNLEKQFSSEIERLLQSRFKRMPVDQKKIIDTVIRTGKTLSIKGKSKQWVQTLFATVAKDIWSESTFCRKVLKEHIENVKNEIPVYLHAPSFTSKYSIFVFFWMKTHGFRKRGDYLIYDEDMKGIISPKKKIYEKIKSRGLPVILGNVEAGVATRERMLYDTAADDNWIVSDDGLMIIGSSKVSFIANYCHYQVNANISIWRLYHFFNSKKKSYLISQKIETVFKFITYIKIRKSDIKCTKMRKFDFKLKDPTSGKPINVWDADFVVGTTEGNEVKLIIGNLMQKEFLCKEKK